MQVSESAPSGNNEEFINTTQMNDVEEAMCVSLPTKRERNRRQEHQAETQEFWEVI